MFSISGNHSYIFPTATEFNATPPERQMFLTSSASSKIFTSIDFRYSSVAACNPAAKSNASFLSLFDIKAHLLRYGCSGSFPVFAPFGWFGGLCDA